MAVTWDEITPGVIIRYQHLSRARRLAGQPLAIRRGFVNDVYPPIPGKRVGQIVVSALNKDGRVNQSLRRFNVGIDFIESIERAPSITAPQPPASLGGDGR